MDRISSEFVQEERDTFIEESKLTLKLQTTLGQITSAKMKLQSIDAEWWIVINSKKTRSGVCYVPVYFRLSQKPNEAHHKCKFGVAITMEGQSSKGATWFEASSVPTWTSPEIKCQIDEKKKTLALDVVFTFKRTEIAMISDEWLHHTDASREILTNISKMLNDPVFSDFTFVVKGKEFKVHKNILAAASSVFNRLFLSNLKESLNNVCKIEHIAPEIFEDLLYFIYEGKLPKNLKDCAKNLYEAAHYYELELLKKICAGKVQSQLSVTNAIDLYVMAHTYDLEDLKKSAWDIVKRDVIKTEFEGQPLSPEGLNELLAIQNSEQNFSETLEISDDESSEQPPFKQMKLGS